MIQIVVTEEFGAETRFRMRVDSISVDENGTIQFLKYHSSTSLHPDSVVATFKPSDYKSMRIEKYDE